MTCISHPYVDIFMILRPNLGYFQVILQEEERLLKAIWRG
jgi:hypothetical protein